MGETLNLLFLSRENGTFEVQVKESWSGRIVSGNFVPPYTSKQLGSLQKKLNSLDSNDAELREIGYRLFLALCGSETPGANRREASEQSVQAVLRSVIQRTLRRRGTVALTLIFSPGCDEFVRYPWELLHNGDHFLVVSGIFTLTRGLLRPDMPMGCELPVHSPLRVLYIGSSPTDCVPLETEQSFEALQSFVMRGKDYQLLDRPLVQTRLHLPADQQFTHPESGITRTLYDCPALSAGPAGQRCRLVVATHPKGSTKRRVGVERDGVISELFLTKLPQEAFTAVDVVALYLHRGAFENALADEDAEQDGGLAGVAMPPADRKPGRSSRNGCGTSAWSWAMPLRRLRCAPSLVCPRCVCCLRGASALLGLWPADCSLILETRSPLWARLCSPARRDPALPC